ncbi:hypothetical protein [Nocardioides sp. URHA0020]|uniref:hypothetical protein n=1 Tax=Nocardioides sp. URHA0020 TaxID=1380392 RepID=UPI000490B68F|nr:hypothetical protein [Nocardioides sp. URHA0020]
MTIATTAPTRPSVAQAKRFIIPVAVVAGLAVLASVAGIPWTGASQAASGVSLHAEPGQGAKLTITELEPGDSATKVVTIRNSASGQSRLTFEENAEASAFAGGALELRIQQDGRTIYRGPFGEMNDVTQDVGSLAPGASSKFAFTVSLPDDAPFADQGKPATATYTWVNTVTREK